MKTLQNNFTTPEQSKRLLELGVPADSADCYINEACDNRAFQLPDIFSKCRWLPKKKPIPCWSVGRLIEIYNMCVDFDLDDRAAIVIFIQDESPIVQMMEMFEDNVGIMDFSKLEE